MIYIRFTSYLFINFLALSPGKRHFPHRRFGAGTILSGDAEVSISFRTTAGFGVPDLLVGFSREGRGQV